MSNACNAISRLIARIAREEEGVTAIALGDELLGVESEPGVGQPFSVGRGVPVTPPHGSASAEPVLLGAGPGSMTSSGNESSARQQPRRNLGQYGRLFVEWQVDQHVEADDRIEGVRREVNIAGVGP